MNNVQIIGRLTKDADLRYISGAQGQTAVARFTVAVDRPPKQDGTKEADFISCQAWGRKAEVIQQYFQKGSKIGIVGKIRTGSYQNQQGATIYTTDVEVSDIDFLDPKAAQQPNPTTPEYNMQQGQNYYQNQQAQQPVPQQPSARQSQRAATAGTGSRSTRSSARQSQPRTTQAQPTQLPMSLQAPQEEFLDIPDGLADEGLPFN